MATDLIRVVRLAWDKFLHFQPASLELTRSCNLAKCLVLAHPINRRIPRNLLSLFIIDNRRSLHRAWITSGWVLRLKWITDLLLLTYYPDQWQYAERASSNTLDSLKFAQQNTKRSSGNRRCDTGGAFLVTLMPWNCSVLSAFWNRCDKYSEARI